MSCSKSLIHINSSTSKHLPSFFKSLRSSISTTTYIPLAIMRSSIMSLRTAQVLCLAAGLVSGKSTSRTRSTPLLSTATRILTQSQSAQTEGFCVMTSPAKDEVVPAGSDYDIVWESGSSNTGSVYITLLEGSSPSLLQLGPNITSMKNKTKKTSWF